MVLKIGLDRPVGLLVGHHSDPIHIFEPTSLWTVGTGGWTCELVDSLGFGWIEWFKRFFFFVLFHSLKNDIVLTHFASKRSRFDPYTHPLPKCSLLYATVTLFRLQSCDVAGLMMISPPFLWCCHHPTMMPLSLLLGSSPAMSPAQQRCCCYPDMLLPSDDDATVTPFRL